MIQDSLRENSYRTNRLPPCPHVRQRQQRTPDHELHHNQPRKSARLPLSAWVLSHPTHQTEKLVGSVTKNLVSPWRVRSYEGLPL